MRNPEFFIILWIPAFAGMTKGSNDDYFYVFKLSILHFIVTLNLFQGLIIHRIMEMLKRVQHDRYRIFYGRTHTALMLKLS